MAIRVDFDLYGSAFDHHSNNTKLGKVRNTVHHWKQGHRLGEKAEWNTSTADEAAKFPDRAPMRTLSEYQAVKLNYNYRASVLPTINKETVFVPKPSKMQMDKSRFLTEKETSRVVKTCPATTTALSLTEMKTTNSPVDLSRERDWNCSTELDINRRNIFVFREYEDVRALNKTKENLLPTETNVGNGKLSNSIII